MEVVAGVASVGGVVGILGIVGQAVHGIFKLKEFLHEVSSASETVKSFLEAIDRLESALTSISDLLNQAPEEWLVGTEARNTSRLTAQVEKCRADIDEWVKSRGIDHANSSKTTDSFLRRLRVASNESAYSDFHQKIARHLQGLQMSLSVLECSYETHILKKANSMDEGVKNFAEVQTSFNREVIQKFPELNESFIAHLNPVSSQLDRLENSSQMSSASISSLASDVSRILNLISSNPALAVSAKSKHQDEKTELDVATASSPHSSFERPEFDLPELPLPPSNIDSSGGDRADNRSSISLGGSVLQQPSRTHAQWSCDFLPGIEAAFSASGFYCLYCGDGFDQDSAEWSLKGRHLVDQHRYGECNLLLDYDSEETFAQHIQDFHQCSLSYHRYLSEELLDKHRHFGREPGFHRGLESKDQNLTDDFHNIRSRRWEALFDNNRGLKKMHDHFRGTKFVSPSESAEDIQPVPRPWELDLCIALSEEGCIVDGLMAASIFRPWSSSNQYRDGVPRPSYSMGDGLKVSRYEFDDRCDLLFETTRLLRTPETKKRAGPVEAELLRKSSLNSILPRGPQHTAEAFKERSRINSWLKGILKSSSLFKVIMFHTAEKYGVDFSDIYTWLERVLEFWEVDEAATKVDDLDSLSDGAVDSRGSPEVRNITNFGISEQCGIPQG